VLKERSQFKVSRQDDTNKHTDFEMDITISLLAIALLLVVLLIVRRGSKSKPGSRPAMQRPATSGKQKTAFHAVSIKIGANSCEAAKDMEGRRFLSTAAPKMPLPECDVESCSCRFVHHSDRRKGEDRRDHWARSLTGGETGNFRQEQRKGPDRRGRD
jgi:hypothetical protein